MNKVYLILFTPYSKRTFHEWHECVSDNNFETQKWERVTNIFKNLFMEVIYLYDLKEQFFLILDLFLLSHRISSLILRKLPWIRWKTLALLKNGKKSKEQGKKERNEYAKKHLPLKINCPRACWQSFYMSINRFLPHSNGYWLFGFLLTELPTLKPLFDIALSVKAICIKKNKFIHTGKCHNCSFGRRVLFP